MEYSEPKIAYSKERYGQRVARLSNGGMCIVEKTYKPRRKSWKWEAVKCEPHVFDLEDVFSLEFSNLIHDLCVVIKHERKNMIYFVLITL